MNKRISCAIGGWLFLTSLQASATDLTFSSAQATAWQHPHDFPSDPTNYAPSLLIDGNPTKSIGWAIYPAVSSNQTALLTLSSPLAAGPQTLTFKMYFDDSPSAFHLLGDFSLGYTTATSPTLTSSETTFTSIISTSSLNGSTLTYTASGEILDTGNLPATDVYTIKVTEDSAAPITGIFINTIPNNDLPYGGSGRGWTGNFIETGFTASVGAVPEPEEWAMMLLGLPLIGWVVGRKQILNAAK